MKRERKIFFRIIFIVIIFFHVDLSKADALIYKDQYHENLYLIGELHTYTGSLPPGHPKLNDGIQLLQQADEIWIERKQAASTRQGQDLKLALKSHIWDAVESYVFTSLKSIFHENEQEFKDNFDVIISSFRHMDPIFSYVMLIQIQHLTEKKKSPLQWTITPGLKGTFEIQYNSEYARKIRYLESEHSASEAWHSTCNNTDANILFEHGINDILKGRSFELDAQDIILSHTNPEEKLDQLFRTNPIGEVLYRCVIAPRNIEWARHMKKMHKTPRKIVFVVGAGHLIGHSSLNRLLNGFFHFDFVEPRN